MPDLQDMRNNDPTWVILDTAQEAWDMLRLVIFVKLSETMLRRVQDIIKSKGGIQAIS